jgi:hypothetical protein
MITAAIRETSQRDSFMTVKVRDPNGHRSVVLEDLRMSATVPEIRARAVAALRLQPDIDWNIRQDRTGRLLRDEQQLRELADESAPQTELTMQPDATLG